MDKPKGKYVVYVDDNFHYADESERYKHGEFATCEEAVAECKKIVDRCFDEFPKGTTADEMMKGYLLFGDDPFILCEDKTCKFSARDYAREKCAEIAAKK